MPVLKNINVQIFKFEPNKDGTVPKVIFQSVAMNTLDFPHKYVQAIMLAVTDHVCDDDDHSLLNNLHCHGKCAFKFGSEWEYYIEASVTYPE